MPDLVQNHSIRDLNPPSTITSSINANLQPETLHISPIKGERETSYRKYQVDHLIRRPEEPYSDVPHRPRLDMLGQHEASLPLHPHTGNIYRNSTK